MLAGWTRMRHNEPRGQAIIRPKHGQFVDQLTPARHFSLLYILRGMRAIGLQAAQCKPKPIRRATTGWQKNGVKEVSLTRIGAIKIAADCEPTSPPVPFERCRGAIKIAHARRMRRVVLYLPHPCRLPLPDRTSSKWSACPPPLCLPVSPALFAAQITFRFFPHSSPES